MGDYAGPGLKHRSQLTRSLDRPECTVEDEVPVVGSERRVTRPPAEGDLHRSSSESAEVGHLRAPAEGHYLYGESPSRTEDRESLVSSATITTRRLD